MVDCILHMQKFRIINVYTAPSRVKKVQLFKKLRELLCVGFNIILCGDFNTVTDAKDRIANSHLKYLNPEGKLLTSVCNDAKLGDVFRSLNPDSIGFTRFDGKTKTRIDRIYLSGHMSPINYETSLFESSDHLLVQSVISVGKSEKKKGTGS